MYVMLLLIRLGVLKQLMHILILEGKLAGDFRGLTAEMWY